jgi:hypothetical protein
MSMRWYLWFVVGIVLAGPAEAQVIIANGAPAPGQNQFYSINISTGVATTISPISSSIVAGLASRPDGSLLGLQSNNLVSVNAVTNATSVIGPLGLSATGFDILTDGRGFTVPTTTTAIQLHQIDLSSGTPTALSTPTAIRDAVITAGGPSSNPFIISLGSVGGTLYGIDTNSSSLIALNPDTGSPSVVGGAAGSITAGTLLDGTARNRFSGFASLTGVDSNGDGQYDRLFGGVNFFDDDNNPGTPTIRYGGIVEFNLTTGSWELIGNNPSLIYFGMASAPIPEPKFAIFVALVAAWLGSTLATRINCSTAIGTTSVQPTCRSTPSA